MGINDLAIDPVTLRLGSFAPLPSAAPFTQGTASSYLRLLEDMRAWLRDDLIPFLNENTGQQQWDSLADILAARIQAALNQQQTNVNAQLADALAKVIAAHIVVTDPIIDGVWKNADSQTRKDLDYAYKLNDVNLLQFLNAVNNGNPATQFKARIEQLYGLSSQKIRDAVEPSGDNAFRNYLDGRYINGGSTFYDMSWGGDSGARIGDGGQGGGMYTSTDSMRYATARLLFGSTAIWGGSVLTGLSGIGQMDLATVVADGVYEPYSGGPPRRVSFLPLNSNDMRCFIDRGNGFEVINVLPNPPAQSTMRISIRGRVTTTS